MTLFANIMLLPILALLALMSIETTVEAFTTYSALAEAGAINGLDLTISVANEGQLIDDETLCTFTQITTAFDSCQTPQLSSSSGGVVTSMFTLPPATETAAFGGGTPSQYRVQICYSEPDQVNRAWRKFEDSFSKDKSCKLKPDFTDYPPEGGPVTATSNIVDTFPNGAFVAAVFVKCADQGSNEFCHIDNPQLNRRMDRALYFRVAKVDSRPTNLFVAVIISVIIGPVLLVAFIIYERGVVAKAASS